MIIPTIVSIMALVLLKFVDDKRRKTGRSRVNAIIYALVFGATFAFAWGISFLQKSNGDVVVGPDIDIEKMIELTDKSAKAPF